MIDETLMLAEEQMLKVIENLNETFTSVRTGRANAMILNRIKVDYYGVMTPINQIAAIKTPDAHMLVVEPWEKSMIAPISHAIQSSDLGVTPSNDGTSIRLPFPQPTEERRRELVKQCKNYAEEARVGIRNARRDANSAFDKMKKAAEVSEDDAKGAEKESQKLTDRYIAEVEEVFKKKEAEVMEI
ncbi:MAG: ribosome recycling factor [Eggerthellaceae bacterium]|nr:ribosome recycling factor [Eggerthellaceae bacterium]